ncbi:hypothetical protein I7I48_01376 [Histoplasma ohiense]|nr:hypothetical protein I7I48_01376 [Histoplasma ohiense (nom. inval.)]
MSSNRQSTKNTKTQKKGVSGEGFHQSPEHRLRVFSSAVCPMGFSAGSMDSSSFLRGIWLKAGNLGALAGNS